MSDGVDEDAILNAGVVSTVGVTLLAGFAWLGMTYTDVVGGFLLFLVAVCAAVVGLVVAIIAQGYFWLHVAPEIARRLAAWYDHFGGDDGGEKA